MMRRTLGLLLLFAACVPTLLGGQAAQAGAPAPQYRPDAWIKLCGQSNGCVINPLPHPWLGKNIYNKSAFKQTVHQYIDNGEGVRYWMTFQNDGSQPDTFSLHGCQGTKLIRLNRVLVGFYKDTTTDRDAKITDQFLKGTWTVDLAPGETIGLTLNIITSDPSAGHSYRCPVRITSAGDPTKSDTVAVTIDAF